MNEYTPDEICAKLTTGACSRDIFPQMKYNQGLKDSVIKRLDQAGYNFIDDPISNSYDARIKPQIRSLHDLVEDEIGNGLTMQAKALIAILWGYLILPRINQSMKEDLKGEPTVTEEQLFENFKQHIGTRQSLKRSLTLLRKYNFIEGVWGQKNTIKAGPRLTTAIDSVRMYDLVKDKVIDFLISENDEKKDKLEQSFDKLEESIETNDSKDISDEEGEGYASAF